METEPLGEIPLETAGVQPLSPRRHLWPTVVFIVCILAGLIFAWDVFSTYRKIQTGEINPALGYSSKAFTTASDAFLALAESAQGSGSLATKDDPSIGSKDAKLTIVEFGDFACPYTAQANAVVDAILKQYPDDVRLIFRDFPLVDVHPDAELAAEAAGCAGEQGKYREMHGLLLEHQDDLSQTALVSYAASAGIDMERFSSCLTSGVFASEVSIDVGDGQAAGVTGTPTFFFNGVKVQGSIPFSIFSSLVHAFAS